MSETHKKRVAAVIVAAGRGTRAGGEIPKQWQQVAGRRVIDWTLAAFRSHPAIDEIVVVVHPDDVERLADEQDLIVVQGGDSRSQSVDNGLRALENSAPDAVLIHDAARACVSAHVISNVIDEGAKPAFSNNLETRSGHSRLVSESTEILIAMLRSKPISLSRVA